MEYEVQVERDKNGRVIVDFYGLDFDITDEFVNGKCHKVIFGDPIVFVLKDETKEGPVENSSTVEETSGIHTEVPESEHSETSEEKHNEATGEPEKHDESSEETQPNNDSQQGVSEGTTHEESPVAEAEQHEPEQPAENTSEENHTPDDSNNENTPAEEDVMKDPKEAEHNPETQEGEN